MLWAIGLSNSEFKDEISCLVLPEDGSKMLTTVLLIQVWLYFIGFIIITRCALDPLFLGVLIDHLGRIQGTASTTILQKNWKRFQGQLKKASPYSPAILPKSAIRRRVFVLVNSDKFLEFCNFVLLGNVIVLAANYYDINSTWNSISYWLNIGFVSVYLFEIVCRMIAYALPFFEDPWYVTMQNGLLFRCLRIGASHVCLTSCCLIRLPLPALTRDHDFRNIFDLTVVIFGVLELCSLQGFDFRAVLLFRVVKSFRILRALRRVSQLQLILGIVRKSTRLILGCLVLMTVFVFFFAVISCQVLAGVKYGQIVGNYFNFDTTLNAFQVFFPTLHCSDSSNTSKSSIIRWF